MIKTDTKIQPKPLFLVMRREWFNEIEVGRKIEEYRDRSPFYVSRFCTVKNNQITGFKDYKTAILQEGYRKGARRIIIEVKGITAGNWFTVHLGEILERQNF